MILEKYSLCLTKVTQYLSRFFKERKEKQRYMEQENQRKVVWRVVYKSCIWVDKLQRFIIKIS